MRRRVPSCPDWNLCEMHAGFWLRRMGHDTAVHRFDACLTLERPFDVDADWLRTACPSGSRSSTRPGRPP
jgi:hypothetical protein